MICFHNVNICGAARGAHVKGAGPGIDLARGEGAPGERRRAGGGRRSTRGGSWWPEAYVRRRTCAARRPASRLRAAGGDRQTADF